MHCPNCSNPVSANAALCSSCGADFTTGSNWKPVPTKLGASKPPFFSGTPKLVHAPQAIPVFLVLGPLIGVAMLALSIGNGVPAFAVIGAYAAGGPPALFAGLIYCALTLLLVAAFPRVLVRRSLGLGIGLIAGGFGGTSWFYIVTGDWSRTDSSVLALSLVAGAGCGFIAGWLVPVGRPASDPRQP